MPSCHFKFRGDAALCRPNVNQVEEVCMSNALKFPLPLSDGLIKMAEKFFVEDAMIAECHYDHHIWTDRRLCS